MIPASKFLNLASEQITPQAEKEFFSSLRLRNGTYKTTFQRRFSEINHALKGFIKSGDIAVDKILDVGISSGSNTLELYLELLSEGYESRIVGTDMMIEARFVRVLPGCFALVDDTGYPLRYDIFNLTMKPWVVKKDYRSGFFVLRKCINLVFSRRAKKIVRNPGSEIVRKVDLVTPRLRQNTGITIQQDDVTKYNQAFASRFTFIRAANVLNKSYFTDVELVAIVDNIRRYLARPRGALLVARTHEDGVNHGTLFDFDENNGCRILQRFGQGSEIEDIVIECLSDRDART